MPIQCGVKKQIILISLVFTAIMITFAAVMTETLVLTLMIVAASVALLSVKVIFRKNGRFSSQHIHDSKALKQRGIHCVVDQDREMRSRSPFAVSEKSKRS